MFFDGFRKVVKDKTLEIMSPTKARKVVCIKLVQMCKLILFELSCLTGRWQQISFVCSNKEFNGKISDLVTPK